MVGCCQDEGVRHAGSNLFPFKAHMFRKERAAPERGAATEILLWHQPRQGRGWELLPRRSQAAPGTGSQLLSCQDPSSGPSRYDVLKSTS